MNVDELIEKCYNALPPSWKQKPWEHLNHGRAVLDSVDQLNAYIAAYGEMHIVKCRMAMQNFPFDDLVQNRNDHGEITLLKQFELYDWGCGQGIGSLVFIQMLYERNLLHGLRRITLIEPSDAAIVRAEHWIKQTIHPSTEIRCINRYIPNNEDPQWTGMECQSTIAIHICSNILDIREVGLKWLAQMTSRICSYNIYVCVGPLFGGGISRISDFHNYLDHPTCFTDISKYPCSYTTRTRHPFGIEAKCFIHHSTFDNQYVEQSVQKHIDEYQSGDECLRGVLPDNVICAYHNLLEAAVKNSFELYLRPSIFVEHPDFILTNISRGIIIVNVCDDISKFAEEYERVSAIKQALIDTYIKSLKIDTILNPTAYNTIKIGLFFTSASPSEVEEQCANYYDKILENWEKNEKRRNVETENQVTDREVETPKNPTQYLVKLYKENCAEEMKNIQHIKFRYEILKEVKDVILGNWHKYSQGDMTLRLTKRQNELVNNDSPRLRIKGVAGCGKTLIVAFKAVREHIRTGSKVLIVTYNISLIQYIKMRINQVPADFPIDAFDIINYHQFFISKARRYHGNHISLDAYNNANFFDPYFDAIKANNDRYETIIVDEAQDYHPSWFDCLRKYFLSENGRMILCGDGEQNIYNRKMDVTTQMPKVYGFGPNNPWRNISDRHISRRMLNPQLASIASLFAKKYELSSESLYIQNEFNFEYKMGYWNIDSKTTPFTLAQNIGWILEQYELAPKDVVIIGQTINLLRDIDYNIRTNFNHRTMTTFESKEEYDEIKSRTLSLAQLKLDLKAIRRVAKVHFTTDVDMLKFATIQSFKGWESKSVILIIQPAINAEPEHDDDEYVISAGPDIPTHIYTAITRARENLFILNCGNQKYHLFFQSTINNIQND